MQTPTETAQFTQILSEGDLFRLVRAVSRRMWLKDTLRIMPRAIALALLGIIIGQLAGPRFGAAAAAAPAVLGLGAGVALLVSRGRQMPGTMAAAIQLDLGLDLKERVSTAIHLVKAGADGVLAEEQVMDARRHASVADVGSAYRVTVPWRDLGAAVLLAVVLALLAMTPLGVTLREGLGPSAAVQNELAGAADADAQSGRLNAVESAGAERDLDELRRALEQLELSSNPEALAQQEALAELGAELRTSSVSRDFGRELENGNLAAAAEELGQLAEAIAEMNRGEIAELIRDLERAAEITAGDPILGAEFSRAAESLDAGQNRSAAEEVARAADSLGRLEPVLAAEEELQERIAELEREISKREAAGALPGADLSDRPDSTALPGAGDLSGDMPGAGLESDARGRERGDIEMLGLDERLDAAGNLEIVRIEASEDAPAEDFAPPATQLGGDPESSLEPSAGEYGYVQPLPEIGGQIAIDAGGVVVDYFSEGQQR